MSHSKLRLVETAKQARVKAEQQNQDSDDPGYEAELSAKARDEQLQYIELLFTKYRNTLLGYLSRLTQNDEDASELLQETYERLLKQENLDHLEVNARAYLFKIATNLVRDKARRDKVRQRDQHQSIEDSELVCDQPSPHMHVEWSKAVDLLKEVMQELNPRCRQIFILHRIKHLSYPEIADTLGITTRTVERNMSVALTHCKEKLRGVL